MPSQWSLLHEVAYGTVAALVKTGVVGVPSDGKAYIKRFEHWQANVPNEVGQRLFWRLLDGTLKDGTRFNNNRPLQRSSEIRPD